MSAWCRRGELNKNDKENNNNIEECNCGCFKDVTAAIRIPWVRFHGSDCIGAISLFHGSDFMGSISLEPISWARFHWPELKGVGEGPTSPLKLFAVWRFRRFGSKCLVASVS